MALVHDDDLVQVLGVGDLTSLETLQPDVVMDYLQKSKFEIGVMSDSWTFNNESPRTVNDTERMNVAMLSEQLHNLHRSDSEPIASGSTCILPGPRNESSGVDTGVKLESIPPDHASRHTFGLEQAQSRLLLSDVFSDNSGVIEGEQPVRGSSIRGKSWFYEHPVVYDDSESRPGSPMDPSYVRPVITTPSTDQSADGRTASHSINVYTFISREISASTSTLDLVPSPPTSERPGYPVYYTTINTLNDDILLRIFDDYRLDDENAWNVRLGWRKISQVCQRWRHLTYSSAFHLGMHIHCTNGAPIVETLDHLPPLPLFINYRFTSVTVRRRDELGIHHALRLRGRVRRIDLHLPSSMLQKFLVLMDEPFPILEHLSLSSTVDNITTPTLPVTFLSPNLRHLALLGISLPKRLRLLSSTASVVTLVLTNIRASGYFRPRLLVARLQSLPQLEELSIGFSIPIPRPGTSKELLGKQGPPVTLPNLKDLTFQGVSAYLERIVAQIRAPLLERLDIMLFNQLIFALPHLSHLINITERLKLPTANVFFERDEVSITTTGHSLRGHYGRFSLRVRCKQLDWQIDCAAQVCSAFMPTLSGVEWLSLDLYDKEMPAEWQNGEIDGTTWHELLRSFIGVKTLHICGGLSKELSRALQVSEIGSDPGLLPDLQELASGIAELLPYVALHFLINYASMILRFPGFYPSILGLPRSPWGKA
ncbi:hypothetical protein EDB85DRAFT_2292934 [Lactarius pseudohatsudake]|nr:hypothetical protein EDB85DRAFT_2292934 [Lactarius pseudohatsudake]